MTFKTNNRFSNSNHCRHTKDHIMQTPSSLKSKDVQTNLNSGNSPKIDGVFAEILKCESEKNVQFLN